MNNNELNEIKSAIDQTHSPSTSQSTRQQLYRYLEDKTSDLTKCKQMGYYFINSSQDQYRLFGYHCIRIVVKQWYSLQISDKSDLKHLSIQLFKFNLNQITSNNTIQNINLTLLKEKISELIVNLAQYSWPHEWGSLLNELFKISQTNPNSLEMLFIILKDLYFICGDRQIIPEKRKKKIKDELMNNNQQIMQIFSVTLLQCFNQIFASNDDNDNNNNDNNNNNKNQQQNQLKIAQNILRRCLEAMPKYLNQFPLKTILQSQVLIGLAKILQSVARTSDNNNVPLCYDEFYRFGLLSIIYFFMRKFTELNTYEVKERIQQERVILTVWNIEMETCRGLYIMTHENDIGSGNQMALLRLDNQLECMIRKLKLFNKMLVNDHNDLENNNLASSIRSIFLSISEYTMQSTDLRIRLRSMGIWTFILDESNILPLIGYDANKNKYAQSDKFDQAVIGIMKYVLQHFEHKFHDLKSFETEEEWQSQRNTLKSKISRLLQQCFVLCPFKGMECIGQFTLSILNCDNDTVHVNSIGHATIENARYIALDGLCDVYRIIFENSINYTFKRNKRKPRYFAYKLIEESLFDNNSTLLKMLEQLHQILLNWKCPNNDTQLQSRIYPLLSYLVPLYCRQPKYLQITFDKYLTDFPKLLPLAPCASDAFDIKCNAVACKRRIAFALLHIAKRIPFICVKYIEPIWKKVMGIIRANFSTFKSINNEKEKKQSPPQQDNNNNNNNGVVMASIMDLSEGPVCHLFELLVCISNGLQDTNHRSKVLSDLLSDVVDNFNSNEIQSVITDSNKFCKMIQFPQEAQPPNANIREYVDERIRFAYHIRTILNILQSTLTASLLSEGQTGLKDLFHTANLDGLPKIYGPSSAPSAPSQKIKLYDSNQDRNNKKRDIASWPLFCAVFPNVLKLNKLLTFMYTKQFKQLLSTNYHSIIIALDVKSLYNLYGLKHDELLRNPTLKPKEIIPLEKAVIWIQNVRDYVSRIIAVASYYDESFFAEKNAINMIIESVTSYWTELPLSHLAIILKHFFMNFVQLCSPKYYSNIIPFLYQFLSVCFKKLNECWQQYINEYMENNQLINTHNTNNNNYNQSKHKLNKQNSSYLRNEVYHEFALRDSSQKLWMAIAMISINHKERGFILLHDDKISKNFRNKQKQITPRKTIRNFNNDFINNFGAVIDTKYHIDTNEEEEDRKKNINICDTMTLKQDKLVMLMLNDSNLCLSLLNGIQSSLNWLDNNCHVRISQVASKLITFIAKYEMKHLYNECGKIFKQTLNALSRNLINDNQANAELNILCVTICQLLGPLCGNMIINILKTIPNIDMDDAETISKLIISKPGKHPNASYRQSIKAFTSKYVIGKQNILSSSK